MKNDTVRSSALAGLRVLEIGVAPGLAYAGKLLADFGADVVKVELPAGDDARRRIPLLEAPGADGALHRWLNSSKRSVVVDWERYVDGLFPLLDGADVVITAVPPPGPGAPATCRALAPDVLREGRSRLIVAHLSDFGPDGPLAGWLGGELVLYALSGLLAASGPCDRPPVAHGTGVAWLTSGTALAVGVVVAPWERARSGHGQVLDVAGLDAMIGAQAALPFIVSFTGASLRRAAKTQRVDLGVLPCADGYIASVIGRDGWERLVALLDEPELMQEKFLDRGTIVEHMAEASAIVLRRLGEETRDHWFHGAQELRMPFAKVQGARDLAECPQLNDRGFFITVEGADGRRVPADRKGAIDVGGRQGSWIDCRGEAGARACKTGGRADGTYDNYAAHNRLAAIGWLVSTDGGSQRTVTIESESLSPAEMAALGARLQPVAQAGQGG